MKEYKMKRIALLSLLLIISFTSYASETSERGKTGETIEDALPQNLPSLTFLDLACFCALATTRTIELTASIGTVSGICGTICGISMCCTENPLELSHGCKVLGKSAMVLGSSMAVGYLSIVASKKLTETIQEEQREELNRYANGVGVGICILGLGKTILEN